MNPIILQICFAVLTAIAALLLTFSKQLVQALYLLFAVLFGVAALFVTAGQTFVAVVQLVLYVGGILILMLFGVLLSRKSRGNAPSSKVRNPLQALLLALVTGIALGGLIFTRPDLVSYVPGPAGLHEIGVTLLSRMAIPFELVTILLMVALVGASTIVRPEKEEQR